MPIEIAHTYDPSRGDHTLHIRSPDPDELFRVLAIVHEALGWPIPQRAMAKPGYHEAGEARVSRPVIACPMEIGDDDDHQ